MVQDSRNWRELGTDLLRGVAGGAIIGLPLVYTMELWFIGMYISDWYIVAFLIFALAVDTGLNHASGFAPKHDFISDIGSSITALGISSVLGFIYLSLIGMVRSGTSFSAIISMTSVLAVPVSVGFSVANTQFGGKTRTGGDRPGQLPGRSDEDIERRRAKADVRDIGITIAGATIFVFSVAPIEEVAQIATRTTGYHWAALVVFSILLTYGMVFLADFSGRKRRHGYRGLLQQPIPETILAYSFSVLIGLLLMFLLGKAEIFSAVSYTVANAAVIGLPASVGGAAGRLII